MGRYALVIEAHAGRAAQLSRIVEAVHLAPTLASNGDEALFHVQRLGAPAVVLLQASAPGEATLELLKRMRVLVPARAAPCVVIADSRQVHELLARQMIELNVAALLSRVHPPGAIERAVRAVLQLPLGPAAPSGPPAVGRAEPILTLSHPAPAASPAQAPAPAHVEALQVAERLAEHPLVEQLARIRLDSSGATDDYLHRVAAETARAFNAPRALLWVQRLGRVAFAAHPRPNDGAALRDGGGSWGALRNALAGAPLHAADAALHRLLARNPLVADGQVRCLVGAPIVSADGGDAGAVCLTHETANGLAGDLLDPLTFWAHRLATELPALRLPEVRAAPANAPRAQAAGGDEAPGDISRQSLVKALLASMDAGILMSDARGLIGFASPRVAALLGLGQLKLAGMTRAELFTLIGVNSDAPDAALSALAAAGDEPLVLPLRLTRPELRHLRWQTRPIKLGAGAGRIDEVLDVGREAAQAEALESRVRVDALTGLANRAGGEEALGREIARTLRGGDPLSVALVEVDGIADLAPELGEQVLRAAAWVLRDTLRGSDLAARHGPSTLLAILPGVSSDKAALFAERLRRAAERTAVASLPRFTLACGLAELDPTQDVERLLATARAALGEAQRQGGNVVV